MTELQSLKERASSIGAIIYCPQCQFEEGFEDFLDRDERVDEETETVDFGCPECGSDSVDLGKYRSGVRTFILKGLEDLESLQ